MTAATDPLETVSTAEVWPEIRAAYAAGDLPRCETLLATLPTTELASRWQVRIAGRREDWTDTRDRATAYLAAFPPAIEVVQALARACNKLKNPRRAAAAWRLLTELIPDSVEALRQSARANGRLGNDAVAVAAARQLASLAETDPGIASIAAATLLELDQIEALASLAETVARVDTTQVEPVIEQFAGADEWRGLASAIGGARRAAPDTPSTIDDTELIDRLLSRAVRHERDAAPVEAINDFRAVLVLSPAESLARRGVDRLKTKLADQARALARIGAHGEAIDSFRVLYRIDPSTPATALPLGRALMNAEQFEQAEDVWRGAIALDPDLEEPAVQLARTDDVLDRPFAALAAWDAVLARWPANEEANKRRKKLSNVLFKRGRDAIAAGDAIAASRYLLAVPDGTPEHAGAAERLERVGRLLVKDMRAAYKNRDFAAVVAAGSVGRAVAPDNFDLHRLLAKAAAKLRRPDLAIEAWARVVALNDTAEARLEIARQRIALGDFDDAERGIAAALSLDPETVGAMALRATLEAARSADVTRTSP